MSRFALTAADLAAYAAGEANLRSLAAAYEVSHETIRRALQAAGVEIRRKGRRPPHEPSVTLARELAAGGLPVAEIRESVAAIFGRVPADQTIRRWIAGEENGGLTKAAKGVRV